MTRVNNDYDENVKQVLFKVAQKLGVKELSSTDIKRTMAECRVAKIDLGIDRV